MGICASTYEQTSQYTQNMYAYVYIYTYAYRCHVHVHMYLVSADKDTHVAGRTILGFPSQHEANFSIHGGRSSRLVLEATLPGSGASSS